MDLLGDGMFRLRLFRAGVRGAEFAFCACVSALTTPPVAAAAAISPAPRCELRSVQRVFSERGRNRGPSEEGCALRPQAAEAGKGKASLPPAVTGGVGPPPLCSRALLRSAGRGGGWGKGEPAHRVPGLQGACYSPRRACAALGASWPPAFLPLVPVLPP